MTGSRRGPEPVRSRPGELIGTRSSVFNFCRGGYGNTASEPVFIYTKFGCLLRHPPAVSAALTPYGLRNSHIKPGLLNLFQVSFATMRKKVRRRRRKYTRPSFGSAADFYVIRFKSFFRITSGFVTGSQQGPEQARSRPGTRSSVFNFIQGVSSALLQIQYV